MSFSILWFIAAMNANGPITANMTETNKFKSEAECAEFGKQMSQRVADYARGRMQLDWDDKVVVAFQCGADGQGT